MSYYELSFIVIMKLSLKTLGNEELKIKKDLK